MQSIFDQTLESDEFLIIDGRGRGLWANVKESASPALDFIGDSSSDFEEIGAHGNDLYMPQNGRSLHR
jgi:hypothetical protein